MRLRRHERLNRLEKERQNREQETRMAAVPATQERMTEGDTDPKEKQEIGNAITASMEMAREASLQQRILTAL